MKTLALIISVVAIIIALHKPITIEDIHAFEDCIQEQYGMSSTEYYSLTGIEPECR